MRNLLLILTFLPVLLSAQKEHVVNKKFTLADTLRGQLRVKRTCFNLQRYDLTVRLFPETKSILGHNQITLKRSCITDKLQIDLFDNMIIDSIKLNNQHLKYKRIHHAIFIDISNYITEEFAIDFYYHGVPQEAKNPPWDGGFTWTETEDNFPWISVSCQGLGASVWWPCMDHQSIEPQSMSITIIAPDSLQIVCNGEEEMNNVQNGLRTSKWNVSYPINSYNVHFSVGQYVHFSDQYISKVDQRTLALDYYVLEKNKNIAQQHFKQVPLILEAMEHYFGSYPYYKDGYALIETPFVGMEHQSGIAYGNHFKNGYLGYKTLPNMEWDYIIVHETGHEWWGNYLTASDIADIWLHEGFTTYSEALYVEYVYGYDTAMRYLQKQSKRIANREPLVGPKNVNYHRKDSDPYYKGSLILNTLRHVINDDDLWFAILKEFNSKGGDGSIETQDFIDFMGFKTSLNFEHILNQYLYHKDLPQLLYKFKTVDNQKYLYVKWEADEKSFDMPLWIDNNNIKLRIEPKSKAWTRYPIKQNVTQIDFADKKYLIEVKKL